MSHHMHMFTMPRLRVLNLQKKEADLSQDSLMSQLELGTGGGPPPFAMV